MPKFQVIKCSPMTSRDPAKPWTASMVKGLFTDDEGEIEMVEVMLFGQNGQQPPVFSEGQICAPVFGVRRNKSTNRPEFTISSLRVMAAAAVKAA